MNPRFDLRWLYLLLGLIFATLYVALSGCDTKAPAWHGYPSNVLPPIVQPQPAIDPDVLRLAVFYQVSKALPFFNHDTEPMTPREAECALVRIAETRAWVKDHITDTQIKGVWYSWLDNALDEVRERSTPTTPLKYAQMLREKRIVAGRELAETLPQPPITKEQCQ